MDSPKDLLVGIVERWKSGANSSEDILVQLELHDQFVENWAKALQEIAPPPGLEVGPKLQATALEGLQMLWEASGALREAVLRDDFEAAQAALSLAAEGQELVDEAMFLTREKLEEPGSE